MNNTARVDLSEFKRLTREGDNPKARNAVFGVRSNPFPTGSTADLAAVGPAVAGAQNHQDQRMSTLRETVEAAAPFDVRKAAAGRAALDRALRLGYCITAARALQRVAIRESRFLESAVETANRVVWQPLDSVMFHATSPGPAA